MIQKILEFQKKLIPGPDKLGHFYFGFLYAIVGIIGFFIFDAILLISLPSVILAIAKEYRDSKGYGAVEFLDFVFTVIPSIIFTILILIYQ